MSNPEYVTIWGVLVGQGVYSLQEANRTEAAWYVRGKQAESTQGFFGLQLTYGIEYGNRVWEVGGWGWG